MTRTDFVFWKTRIAAALKLWRSGVRGFQAAALDHMQECQREVPSLYKAMQALPTEALDDYEPSKL